MLLLARLAVEEIKFEYSFKYILNVLDANSSVLRSYLGRESNKSQFQLEQTRVSSTAISNSSRNSIGLAKIEDLVDGQLHLDNRRIHSENTVNLF